MSGEFLECQDCGDELRELAPAEAQQMADRPENFVAFCRECRAARAAGGVS